MPVTDERVIRVAVEHWGLPEGADATVARDPVRVGGNAVAGLAVSTRETAGAFESIGDEQLRRFKADEANRGSVMDRGLWRYSRHPNYFGDSVVWWSIWIVAAAAGAWWTVAGPLLMTILLLRVSGVTVLERSMGKRRPGYTEYVARTSAFVPMPRRRADR